MNTIEYHYNEACKLACEKVERMARGILKRHSHLDEFIMAMGSYFFTAKNGKDDLQPITQKMNASWDYYYVDTVAYLKPLNDFIGKWDEYLKITGEPMRFTANGPKVTDW